MAWAWGKWVDGVTVERRRKHPFGWVGGLVAENGLPFVCLRTTGLWWLPGRCGRSVVGGWVGGWVGKGGKVGGWDTYVGKRPIDRRRGDPGSREEGAKDEVLDDG